MSEEQVAAQAAMAEWVDRISHMKTVDDFNHAMQDMKGAPKAVQAAFAHAAKEAGLIADKKAHKYVAAKSVSAE
jgi:hypothetical protein